MRGGGGGGTAAAALVALCASACLQPVHTSCISLKDSASCEASTAGCTWYAGWNLCWETDGGKDGGSKDGSAGDKSSSDCVGLSEDSCGSRGHCAWDSGYGCYAKGSKDDGSSDDKDGGKEGGDWGEEGGDCATNGRGVGIAGSLISAGHTRTWLKFVPVNVLLLCTRLHVHPSKCAHMHSYTPFTRTHM